MRTAQASAQKFVERASGASGEYVSGASSTTKDQSARAIGAKEIYKSLKPYFMTAWDDRGNIGKRYFAQDEAGTPYCITVDFQTLEDNTVTIRDRDSAKQERLSIDKLSEYISKSIS